MCACQGILALEMFCTQQAQSFNHIQVNVQNWHSSVSQHPQQTEESVTKRNTSKTTWKLLFSAIHNLKLTSDIKDGALASQFFSSVSFFWWKHFYSGTRLVSANPNESLRHLLWDGDKSYQMHCVTHTHKRGSGMVRTFIEKCCAVGVPGQQCESGPKKAAWAKGSRGPKQLGSRINVRFSFFILWRR